MIEQLILQSFPYVAGAVVFSASNLTASYKQREQNIKLAGFNARIRRKELELSRQHRLEELLVRHELDRRLSAENQARREELERLQRTYPIEAGPGDLAASACLLYPDMNSRSRPIIILQRVTGEGDRIWKNLHTEAWRQLAELQSQGLIYALTTDRRVPWPNNDLLKYDLGGYPTIVIIPEIGAGGLHLSVGVANLMPYDNVDVLPKTPMMTIEFRQAAELQRFSFSKQFDPDRQEMRLVPIQRLNAKDFNEHEAEREYVKLGAAAISVLVTRLIDHYYLANQYAYTARFDKLLKSFQARAHSDRELSLVDIEHLSEIPEQVVVDLPFYRLRHVLNSSNATPDKIVAAVLRSLAAFGGCDHPEDIHSVQRLVNEYVPQSAEEATAMLEAQKLLKQLPATTDGRSELLELVDHVAARVSQKSVSPLHLSGPKPRWNG